MAKLVNPLIQKFLKVFFHILYTRLAFLYDTVASLSSMGQWQLWRNTAQINVKPGLILELGHGPGHLLRDMKQDGYPIIGLDPSPQMNRLAQHRLLKQGHRADIVRGKAQSLPFSDQVFNSIVSTFPSEYIIDPDTLTEAHRVLSNAGVLTIVGIVEITGSSISDRFARWLYTITGQSGPVPYGWEEHLQNYGFDPRLEQVVLDRSRVTRVVAIRK
jgi:ubiquinone/menaquinone biosynthesis C-methylase UbiE